MKQTDLMPWGKHRGKPLNDIDKRYLRALYNHGIGHKDLRDAVWLRLYGKKLPPQERDCMLTEAILTMGNESIPF